MPSAPQWLFDPFSLDPTNACLWCDDTPVALPPKAFDVLHYLVTHPDRLVTKDELLDAVWPETTVTDAVLRVAIGTLRKVLGDTAQTPRFIATVLGRGYRFVASVEASPGMASGPAGLVLPAAPQTPRVRPAVVAASSEASTRGCPRCQYPNPAAAQFCIACATPLALRCTACGQANLPDAVFCQACATSLPSMMSLPVAPLPGTPEAPPHQSLASSSDAVSSPEAERRRLTVLFCDLVDSTSLAAHLDPEDLRDVVHAYHRTCVEVIHRFDGYIAQYLGDGILVYFGSPVAHEDDAQRAVWTGLGILEALEALTPRLGLHSGDRLAVRLGIHTGLAVVGDVGEGSRHERLALGETPNIAARLQHLAAPNTLLISAATYQLIAGYFTCEALGEQPLRGLAQPLLVYQVLRASGVQSRLEVAASRGLTPLVGREPEVGLLLERWARVKVGMGQVVLLSGEAGIGKSRLVHMLKNQVATESQAWLTPCQCSPYHHNTALYPLIDLLERVTLRFDREDSQQQKLRKLEGLLVQYGLNLVEAMPLLAALLSLQLPADYAPLTVSSEQQKQQTLHTLLTILLRMAAQQPVLFVMEDLHWVDPSTLEFLSLLVDQGPTARILALFTCRPDFSPPWTGRAHLTQVTLPRLTRRQAAEMTDWMAHHKALPPEVVEQVVTKTDGVPLFVEELTKMVLESGLLQEREHRYELSGPLPPLAIPATLHDSLMARLDRLGTVKGLAQLGATLGHEFSYALLQAVSPWDEGTLQHGLHQLVQAEFVYQQGLPPQATYLFKHALIQDAAYQSLLRRTRQQHHQRIAQVLEAQFPEVVAIQPELLAHHYTEACLGSQAIVYWYKAGQRAIQRSSNIEAAGHLTKGLAVLSTLPDTLERTQHELRFQLALGAVFIATKGYAASEVETVYIRAQTLCQALGEMSRLPQVLLGLEAYYVVKAQLRRAHELAEQCLALAQRLQHPVRLLHSHHALGGILFHLGEAAAALHHLEQGITLYDVQPHHPRHNLQNPGVACRSYAALALWWLGYPEQALQRSREALALAEELAHPHSTAYALCCTTVLHLYRREAQRARERAAAAMALATEHSFPFWYAMGTYLYGWALTEEGQEEDGITQIRQGLTAWRATGAALFLPMYLATLAEVSGKAGQWEEAQDLLREALALVEDTGERFWEAEVYRLQGIVLLQQAPPDTSRAAACFQQALNVAGCQRAKSLELRAAVSLSRLWQQEGKRTEAYALLAPIYGWFMEGFDTVDLQEAKALLEELGR